MPAAVVEAGAEVVVAVAHVAEVGSRLRQVLAPHQPLRQGQILPPGQPVGQLEQKLPRADLAPVALRQQQEKAQPPDSVRDLLEPVQTSLGLAQPPAN